MELIEIIKSSILLFTFSLIILAVVAFGLYKIRNQAKKKYLNKRTQLLEKQEKKEILIQKQKTDMNKNNEFGVRQAAKENIGKNEKFVLVNDNFESDNLKAIKSNYQPDIYKFYEELNSNIMFKIKPGSSFNS